MPALTKLSFTVRMLIIVGTILHCSTLHAEDKFVGKTWDAAQLVSIDKIDHSSYDQLLKKYVDDDGMVDYKAWQQNSGDRLSLQRYLEHLGKADSKQPAKREAILAYWINAYNATTIEGILQVYPTTSIRNHTAKLIGYNIWKNLYLRTGGWRINLDSIEHKVLRKMNEPRIHFAIVCASIGCPRLLNEAYIAEKLEQQLATNTIDFFSRAQNLQVDPKSRTLKLSSIMNWFGEDFGKPETAMMISVKDYLPSAAAEIVENGNFRLSYLKYDWSLNEQKQK